MWKHHVIHNGRLAIHLSPESWWRQYVDAICGLNVTLTSVSIKIVNESLDLLSSRPHIFSFHCAIHALWVEQKRKDSLSLTQNACVCRAWWEGANNNCNFTNRTKWLIIIISKREHLSIIIYICDFVDDCVCVMMLHTVAFSTRMIELVQISFRMERVFVVVCSIHSSSEIFGNYKMRCAATILCNCVAAHTA